MKHPSAAPSSPVSRRQFFRLAGGGLGGLTAASALLGGVPGGWVGAAYASDAPEVADLKFGIIALTDCSPLVIAHEKGFFKKYGINATIAKGASWPAIRDSLSTGDLQATHLLLGIALSSSMGIGGAPKVPMVVPWLLNRNGQSISLANALKGKVAADPKALKPLADAAKASGSPMTFAMTYPTGTHAMWMRYYLGAGGIHPDKDVSLIAVPPAQMVANMKIGKMDGFCVGEPWNQKTIADGIGFTSVATQDLWKDHPEKVLGFTAAFAEKNPNTVKAVLKAVHEASVWLDAFSNRPEACRIVSAPTYINCPADVILKRMLGELDYGDGRKVTDTEHCMYFSKNNCNYPQPKFAKWFLSQYRRWGMVEGAPDYEGVAKQVMRPDLYEAAMKEIGYAHGGRDDKPETLFDGATFDPAKPEAYAKGFAVNSLKG